MGIGANTFVPRDKIDYTKGLFVNVTVENLAPCKKLVRVEVDAQKVNDAFEAMTKSFQREARLPGFRPGKAPKDMVAKRYETDIADEVKKKLIPDAYRDAIKEQKLHVVGYPDIEEIQFGKGQALQFAATIETAPEFELPEYKGIAVKREKSQVSDADVERALTMLRERRTNFKTVERETKEGEIASRQQVETANIEAERALQQKRIESEQQVREREIVRAKTIEIAEQDKAIALAEKSKLQSQAQAEADVARALAARAEEQVATARATEIAERQKAIDLVEASKQAQRDAIGITVAAEANKKASEDRAAAQRGAPAY